jgi:hypothetical protein
LGRGLNHMTDNVSGVATKIDWSSLSGIILDGGYELQEVVDGREDAAKLRLRILGSGGRTGLAYFLHLAPADADDQLDIWQTLRDAPHANLNRPVAVGRYDAAGFNTVYLLLADPDEKLAAVVPERPLEWEEAAEVLHSCEKGLAHLHAHGLIHGSVSPCTVEAVGYSVLLNTESVRRLGKKPRVVWNKPQYLAPESKEANVTTAADVWCLGATVFEVLSQLPYGSAGAELERGLPLAAVIQRCLDKNPVTRCTLKESPSFEDAAPPPPVQVQPEPVVPASPAPETVAAPPRAATPAAPPRAATPAAPPPPSRPVEPRSPVQGVRTDRNSAPASRIPHPLTPKAPAKQVTKEDMALVPMGKRHKKVEKRQPVGARIRTLDEPEQVFVMGEATTSSGLPAVSARTLAVGNRPNLIRNVVASVGLALLFAAAVKFIIIPKLQSTEEPLNSGISAQTTSDAARPDPLPNVPGNPEPAPPNPVIPVPANTTSRQPASAHAPEAEPIAAPPVKRELFRVVLSSFTGRTDAAHALDTLAQQHPDLILQALPAKGEIGESKFLVVVGGVLNRNEAQQLQQRLFSKGLKTAHLEPYQN